MSTLLPYVVSGIALGAIYGLAATGLVLTYKTSGIFNFGQGALAAVGAYVYYWLHVENGVGWLPACGVAVFVAGPLMGIAMERFAVRLAPQSTTYKIVGTVGLLLVVEGLGSILFGANTLYVPGFIPGANDSFTVGGVVITFSNVVITAITLLSVALLYGFFRWSRTGLRMRAVVDNPELLALHGSEPTSVRRAAWIIGSTFAALSGVLIAPLVGLDAVLLTFMVVQAFAAAAIGGFTSIPLTLAGALMVGVASDVAQKYALNNSWLSGLPESIPFLILFAVLLIRGKKLVAPTQVQNRPPPQVHARLRVRLISVGLLVGTLATVPLFAGASLSFYTYGGIVALMLLSLGLLVRMSGQVSLCHAALAAIGAVAFSQLHQHGMPWLIALLLSGIITVPIGAVVAIPAIRLSGLFFALATLGFGILLEQLVFPQSWMFGVTSPGRVMSMPSGVNTPGEFYYVVLLAVALAALIVIAIQHARLGSLLRGIAESPRAVTAMGLGTNVTLILVFCVSAFIAAEAGALYGVSQGYANGGDPFYGPFNSLTLLALLALAPMGDPWYAFILATTAIIPAYITGQQVTQWLGVVYGFVAMLVSMAGGQPSMPVRLQRWLQRSKVPRPVPTLGQLSPAGYDADSHGEVGGLVISDLQVRFGGLLAVDGLSLAAPRGRITGLIGPNGAGKTTTFDVCSGFNRRCDGEILLNGQSISALSPAARAQRGLGRTFQTVQLCETLTVWDNVRLACEARRAASRPLSQVRASRGEGRDADFATYEALELCDLKDVEDQHVSTLSAGHRRSVELARCVAASFDLFLLDEPSAGLDAHESQQLGLLLQRVVCERGTGILLVEHDMELVMTVCDHLYVMSSGRMLFDGSPEVVARNEDVQGVYLGSTKADERSTSPGLEQSVGPK